jgi:hypothetical protein
MFAGIRRWDLFMMFGLMAAIFIFELVGVFSPRLVTITQIVKATVPIPVRIMICSWICWHFVVSDIVRQLTPKA